ncbi:hypothetical protein BJV77DRAFT_749916 [Russula vinacea]|nr:hypothetical protein BJV77DRAFT_749916 [Russula vinacea]
MSAQSRQSPSKSSLSIALTEPFVLLRTFDVSGSPLLGEFSPPSVLRGLLALDLSKATKISSIQIELQAMSYTSWTEGMGTPGERKLFSATQIFFRAPSTPSSRRSLSVEPGASSRNEHHQPPPPLPPPRPEAVPALPVPVAVHVADDASQRGRMRVRRRSSADHLVFQRDPVARVNRPLAASPLSFPPTTEEEVIARTPTSAHFVESPSASTSFPPVETPASAHNQAVGTFGHSRVASFGESQKPSRHKRNASGTESLHNAGHRSHSSLSSISSIFGRGSRPSSPVHDEGHPEGLQSNGSERGREKSTKRISLFHHHPHGKKGEALRQEEEHKEVGDGWREFRKGTYTYPISFEIPSHMPASLECDGGSVTWRLVAKVRRPGVFTANLTAIRDVHVVSIPVDGDVDMTGEIQIERPWEDQLQYLFKVSRKTFAIGASFNVKWCSCRWPRFGCINLRST